MKQVILAKAKGIAVIDDDDYERVMEHLWRLHNRGYACADIEGHTVTLHRFVMNARPKSVIDHINHDKLDCRKENLRTCTQSQNKANSYGYVKIRESKYKGVKKTPSGKYVANLNWNGVRISANGFTDEYDCSRAYDALAKEFFGEFALTNKEMAEKGIIE